MSRADLLVKGVDSIFSFHLDATPKHLILLFACKDKK